MEADGGRREKVRSVNLIVNVHKIKALKEGVIKHTHFILDSQCLHAFLAIQITPGDVRHAEV